MSYRVRDFIANRTARPSKALAWDESDPTLQGAEGALADATAQARADLPAAFKRADKILHRRGRNPQQQQPFSFEGDSAECEWCGDDFPVIGRRSRHCSMECRRAHERFVWKQRRRARSSGRPSKPRPKRQDGPVAV